MLRAFIRKAFRLNEKGYAAAVERIEAFLGEIEARMADGRSTVLGDEDINFVDISLASISTLWLQPEQFSGGKCDAARIELERFPEKMHSDINRWRKNYPVTTAFMERLYKEERTPIFQA